MPISEEFLISTLLSHCPSAIAVVASVKSVMGLIKRLANIQTQVLILITAIEVTIIERFWISFRLLNNSSSC